MLSETIAKFRAARLNFAQEHRAVDEWAKGMLSLPGIPYARRQSTIEAILRKYDPRHQPAGQSALIFSMTLPDFRNLITVAANDPLYIRAAECVTATRRWQMLHRGKTASLAEMCRSAGLSRVPVDPYSDAPLRLAAGPSIYSVGPDGDDDRGVRDAEPGRKADGDFSFPVPQPPAR